MHQVGDLFELNIKLLCQKINIRDLAVRLLVSGKYLCLFGYLSKLTFIQSTFIHTSQYNSTRVRDTCTFILIVPPIVSFGIPECTINVDILDLFSRRPDDDSVELKHVALNVII